MKRITLLALVFMLCLGATNQRPVGYAEYVPNTVMTLNTIPTYGVTLPGSAISADVCNVGTVDINFTESGDIPTATRGMLLAAGSCRVYNEERLMLESLQFIGKASGADLRVNYRAR